MVWIINVIYKEEDFDVQAKKLMAECEEILSKKFKIKSAIFYEIDSELSYDEIKKIAEDFIVDHVTENYSIHSSIKECLKHYSNYLALIIYFKKGVTNPEEEIIKSSFDLLLNGKIKNLKIYRVFFFDKKVGKDEIMLISKKLLTNELIHDFEIWSE